MQKGKENNCRNSMYFVYILRCSDGTYYTGITNNLDKRILSHNGSRSGAHYTKTRRPVELIYKEDCLNRSMALKREAGVKKLTRTKIPTLK